MRGCIVANAEVNGHISIWVQSVAGGSLHRVGTLFEGNNIDSASAAFSSDGTGIIYGQGHDVYLMKRDGSSSQRLLTVDNTPHWFRFSPDARTLRFSQWDPNGPMNTLMSANADGKELQKMLKACCGDWTPDGRFFVFLRTVDDHTNFWTLRESKRFSWRKHKDEPSQLTAGPLDFGYPLPGKDGKEIFAIGYNPRAEVIRWDAHIHEFVPYFSGISADGLAFSLDGQWVAYTSYPDGILWLSRVDGSERLQLTSPPLKVLIPRWSPDGRQIAFNAALPRQPWNIYVISKAGGSAERVLPNDQGQKDANWSPDGKSLIFGSAHDPKGSISIFETGSKHVATLPGSRGFFSPRWSPDGKYISAIVTETRKLMLFDVSAQRWTEVSDANVGNSMWSHDGKYLYYQDYSPQDSNYQIVRLRATNRQIEKIVDTNAVGRATTGADGQWFGLTPDDSPLLARDIGTQEIYAIDVEWP
jgi:Tol biopolymer transport system component